MNRQITDSEMSSLGIRRGHPNPSDSPDRLRGRSWDKNIYYWKIFEPVTLFLSICWRYCKRNSCYKWTCLSKSGPIVGGSVIIKHLPPEVLHRQNFSSQSQLQSKINCKHLKLLSQHIYEYISVYMCIMYRLLVRILAYNTEERCNNTRIFRRLSVWQKVRQRHSQRQPMEWGGRC